ncbi:GTP-binding protein [Polaribacter sp.]|nr:GTP-binding protein [Polaribacter sp.]
MQPIRNIAIIAHVDHGKTTLVDKIIDQAKILDDRKERTDLLLDNNDLERERGITILSKNVSVTYKNTKINVIDTPGHADFGGEVERVLKMADGVLLLVDAFEGPMPQTRFVLGKALELGLTPIVVVNKVDKENCTPDIVHEKVFDLMFALEATEEQLDFTTIYGSAKNNWMSTDWKNETNDIVPLLDAVLESIPATKYNEGMGKVQVESVPCGEICAITGLDGFEIGDTVADLENPEALPRTEIDQPTMSMLFTINNSPFFGKEGKFVTSRHIRDRLFKELEKNLALKVETTDSEDKFNVYGRGVLHLSVLIETMRREGYELQVGRPQVIIKMIDGVKHEPMETLSIDVPEDVASKAVNLVSLRKGDLLIMEPKGDLQHLEFSIPSRGLIGLRNRILTATAGQAIINHRFSEYGPYKGDFTEEVKGAIVSSAAGKATAYALNRLQDRGRFFIDINQEIYVGQVIGENSKSDEMAVNLIKGKQLTNMRKSGTDDAMKIAPKINFSLEENMEYIKADEYLEVTPENLRMRKIVFKG